MSGVDLNSLIRAVRRSDLIITPRLNDWLLVHGDDALPEDIAEKVYEQLITKPRNRSASFSASAAGQCERKQLFDYLGMPQDGGINPRLQNIFNDGKWRHLRWQAMLLAAGILEEIEQPLNWKRMRSKGTMDGAGVVPDDHPRKRWRGKEFGFELKGVSAYIYPKVMKDEEIKEEHTRQVSRYFLASGYDLFVVVYENKSTQEWFEWVVEPDEEYIAEQRAELRVLNNAVDNERLPKMLASCRAQIGPVWNDCPYGGQGGVCVKSGNWPNLKRTRKP